LMTEVASLLQVKADERNIYLKFDSQGPVPTTFMSDPVRLKQILFNIIGNAIKFTSEGGVQVTVSYNPDATEGALKFKIKDSGDGIPEDQIQRLFKPFTQVDTSTQRRHGGTGLGLVLSRRLSQMLGGDVQIIDTRVGQGTTFLVSLQPKEVGQLTSQLVSISQEGAGSFVLSSEDKGFTGRLAGTKVLVVDDAVENCNLFRIYLEKAKASVGLAFGGEEALKKVKAGNYDLIFLDLQMPEKDGYEVLDQLRQDGMLCPIVALTAHAMPEERQKTLSYGFDDHISKPVSAEKLISTVERFLSNKELKPPRRTLEA
ncbi:MAG: response regulator, partial [Bdellovibrionales bacterium]|nr:response regulator [Bdellovibrionales bacterium]